MEAIEKAADPETESQDLLYNRRSHPRHSVDEDSILVLLSHGLSLPSHILDVSLEGCRLRTRERHALLERARVEVTFRVNGIALRFMGVIQWTDGKQYVGIRFVDVIARRRELLAEVISEIESAAAAKAAKEAAEREAQLQSEESAKQVLGQPLEQSEQEPAAQPSQLPAASQPDDIAACQTRRRDAMHEDARNSEPSESLPTDTADPLSAALAAAPLKCDRRAQPRHVVDTSATIFLVKIGSRLSGRILDLSLGGCRIRSDQRFPLGIYTRVETEFRLEGLPFRLGGVIQAIHDRHTVGIRFLDVSNRKREQVEQLIEEIAAQGSEE